MSHPRIPRPRGHILGQSWPGVKRIHAQPTIWQRLLRHWRPIVLRILLAIWLGFLAALLFLSTKAHAQDTWNGSDKKMHAGVSFMIGVGTRQVWRDEPLKAWGVALIPGLVKEATDTKPSAKDMVANALGAALGVYTGGLFVATNDGRLVVGYATEF